MLKVSPQPERPGIGATAAALWNERRRGYKSQECGMKYLQHFPLLLNSFQRPAENAKIVFMNSPFVFQLLYVLPSWYLKEIGCWGRSPWAILLLFGNVLA